MSNEPTGSPAAAEGRQLRTTALHAWHVAAGAKMADFAGWEMPIEYPAGTVAEHRAVRAGCGLFDVSHMGALALTGPAAAAALNRLLTNDTDRLSEGGVQYTLLCDEQGGVVDDMLVTRLPGDRMLVVPNAANTDAVRAAITEAVGAEAVRDIGAQTSLIALQGPGSAAALTRLGLPADLDYMTARYGGHSGEDVLVSRTGYTGEHGYELLVPEGAAVDLWEQLVDQSAVAPAGLGARDTLRTEMGYPLHGQDLGPLIDPVTAGLSWAVAWNTDFHGKAALEQIRAAGPQRRLRGLQLTGRGVPRPGMAVLLGGEDAGVVTSGTFSPTLRKGIALALLDSRIMPGDEVQVDVRGRRVSAEVLSPPFVPSSPR